MTIIDDVFETKSRMEGGAELRLTLPDSDKVALGSDKQPMIIKLAGPDSAKYRAIMRERAARRAKGEDVGDIYDLTNDDLAALTLGWSKNIGFGGKDEVECTPENARKLYEISTIIRTQALNFILRPVSFTAASSKTS